VLIDWFTVAAQVINFVVLMALLKRFLYKPIIRAMDERQRQIACRLDEAERARTEAEAERLSYRARNQDWDRRRQAMLAEAKAEADVERQELIRQTRADVEALQLRWRQTLQRQQTAFLRDLRLRAAKQLDATARRVLHDLANADLETRLAEVFLDRLQKLDDECWRALATSMQAEHDAVTIHSAFDLPDTLRQQFLQVLQNRWPGRVKVEFMTRPELICGMEVRTPGHKVSWSIAEYLESLEEEMAKALEGQGADEGANGEIGPEPTPR
jgi:F-type H+-transporting ATPase subunit b